MSDFETKLDEKIDDAYDTYVVGEQPPSPEALAYAVGQLHAKEAALELRAAEQAVDGPVISIDDVFEEVRRTWAIQWEQGARLASHLALLDEALADIEAVMDAKDAEGRE